MLQARSLVVLASLLLAVLTGDFAAGQENPAPPDWAALKSIPTSYAIDDGMRRDLLSFELAKDREQSFAAVGERPRDLQRLFWLSWLLRGWGPKLEGSEGLHTYFFLDETTSAPRVLDALRDAGFKPQTEAFAKIMDLFGTPFPQDFAQRKAHFAWSSPGRRMDQYTTIPNDLNAFDLHLMDLGQSFGTKTEFRAAVAAYAERTPTLQPWIAEARAKLSEEDRLDWLTGQLAVDGPDKMRTVIKSWPRPYQILYLLDQFNAEMLNGSVEQFFFNSTGALAPDVVAAFREVGLPRHASAVARGIAMFRAPYPVDTARRRKLYWSRKAGPPFDKALDRLTGIVDDGAIRPAMLASAKRAGILPQ